MKQLVKGAFLFLTLGTIFWIVITYFEYVLWMNESWRLTMFILFVVVELFLLYRYILIPLLFLFKVRKGIDHKFASRMIGKHFPNVDDRLLNLLELSENPRKSDLLMASIEQRATDLKNVSFVDAVNVRESLKYARYILIPLGILAVIWVTGDVVSFFNSHKRVLNYDVAYERPAPFVFEVLNTDLEVLDNEALTIEVRTIGEVRPSDVQMVVGNERLVMQERHGVYVYTFQPPVGNFGFYLTANGWDSRWYQVSTFETPTLVDFSLELDYPSYLKRSSEVLSGTGNAEVPEGTRITWKISENF